MPKLTHKIYDEKLPGSISALSLVAEGADPMRCDRCGKRRHCKYSLDRRGWLCVWCRHDAYLDSLPYDVDYYSEDEAQ
jgi:hypothetical protein